MKPPSIKNLDINEINASLLIASENDLRKYGSETEKVIVKPSNLINSDYGIVSLDGGFMRTDLKLNKRPINYSTGGLSFVFDSWHLISISDKMLCYFTFKDELATESAILTVNLQNGQVKYYSYNFNPGSNYYLQHCAIIKDKYLAILYFYYGQLNLYYLYLIELETGNIVSAPIDLKGLSGGTDYVYALKIADNYGEDNFCIFLCGVPNYHTGMPVAGLVKSENHVQCFKFNYYLTCLEFKSIGSDGFNYISGLVPQDPPATEVQRLIDVGYYNWALVCNSDGKYLGQYISLFTNNIYKSAIINGVYQRIIVGSDIFIFISPTWNYSGLNPLTPHAHYAPVKLNTSLSDTIWVASNWTFMDWPTRTAQYHRGLGLKLEIYRDIGLDFTRQTSITHNYELGQMLSKGGLNGYNNRSLNILDPKNFYFKTGSQYGYCGTSRDLYNFGKEPWGYISKPGSSNFKRLKHIEKDIFICETEDQNFWINARGVYYNISVQYYNYTQMENWFWGLTLTIVANVLFFNWGQYSQYITLDGYRRGYLNSTGSLNWIFKNQQLIDVAYEWGDGVINSYTYEEGYYTYSFSIRLKNIKVNYKLFNFGSDYEPIIQQITTKELGESYASTTDTLNFTLRTPQWLTASNLTYTTSEVIYYNKEHFAIDDNSFYFPSRRQFGVYNSGSFVGWQTGSQYLLWYVNIVRQTCRLESILQGIPDLDARMNYNNYHIDLLFLYSFYERKVSETYLYNFYIWVPVVRSASLVYSKVQELMNYELNNNLNKFNYVNGSYLIIGNICFNLNTFYFEYTFLKVIGQYGQFCVDKEGRYYLPGKIGETDMTISKLGTDLTSCTLNALTGLHINGGIMF